ncbi:MAG: response regulator [Elusimicrobiota bacterium]
MKKRKRMTSLETLTKLTDSKRSAAQSQILLVSDNPDALPEYQLQLKKAGFHILESINPEQAGRLAHKHSPALTLIGPCKFQHDVCRELKGQHPQLGVFLVSEALLSHKERLTAFSAGACACYGKNVSPQTLVEDIKFFLELPHPLLDAEKTKSEESLFSAPVLIIDDDDEMTRLTARHLAMAGLIPFAASNARCGILLAQKLKPKTIILDHSLPDENGQRVLELLKAHPSTSSIPVILWTAYEEVGREKECLRGGADGYLVKGVHDVAAVPLWVKKLISQPRSSEIVIIRKGTVTLDAAARSLTIGTDTISDLTPLEFKLLTCVVERSPYVLSWDYLERTVRGIPEYACQAAHASNPMRFHAYELKKKLGRWSACLVTHRGTGLQFDAGKIK